MQPSSTERIQELESRLDDFERLDELKTEFLSRAAHELRTPIAVVHGIAATLHLRGHDLSDEQLVELRGTLYEHSCRLTELTDQLLDRSRLDAEAFALAPERFHPRERIEELLRRIAPERVEDVDVGVEPSLVVVTDPHAFERVVANLLTNALRYGEPPIEVRTSRSEFVDVVVQDHGPGVPDDFVPLLFEPFSQAEGSRAEHGSGLGLAIAKSFAEALGGDLRYEPAEPSGARFHFELPRRLAA